MEEEARERLHSTHDSTPVGDYPPPVSYTDSYIDGSVSLLRNYPLITTK